MKTVLCMSGGFDSTTLLYQLCADGDAVFCLSFDYGQRHKKELTAAKTIADGLGIENRSIAVPEIFAADALTGRGEIPVGHYADPSQQSTVVPGRNLVFVAIAAAIAIRRGFDRVAIGVHAGDRFIYPDCRPGFVAAARKALQLSDARPADLYAPFLRMTKKQIALIATGLSVPLELTWTCYVGRSIPCGHCGACIEREEAIAWAKKHNRDP